MRAIGAVVEAKPRHDTSTMAASGTEPGGPENRKDGAQSMERLSPEQRRTVCRVLDGKYKRCMASLGLVDLPQATERCGGFYSDILEYCSNELLVRWTSVAALTDR